MADKRAAGSLLLLAFLCFSGAFFLERKVVEKKPSFKTSVKAESGALPPSVKLLNSLLGSFRTLLVDFLWIRADSLQREGRYFGASELARWITLLQSRVEDGWTFQAWNLGYNISSDLPYDERWPYVKSAVDLLWEKGLKANPGSISMHYEIARLWFFKAGGDADPASGLYRKEVREAVQRILGPKPWTIPEYAESEPLLGLLSEEPVVKGFLEKLKAAGAGVEDVRGEWVELWHEPGKYFGGLSEELKSELSGEGLLWAFDRALRARAWKRTFGFSMQVLKKAFERYGAIGLGTPEGMTVCWCTKGLSLLKEGELRQDAIAVWRMRYRALRRLFLSGGLHLAEKIDDDYREMTARVKDDPVHKEQWEPLTDAWTAFLRSAVPLLFINGRREASKALYASLEKLESGMTRGLTYSDFSYHALFRDLVPGKASRRKLVSIVRALLVQSLWYRASGYEKEAGIYMTFVRDMHARLVVDFDYAWIPPMEELVKEARAKVGKRLRKSGRGR